MRLFTINLLLAILLFFINGIIGRIQYGFQEGLFHYAKFEFGSQDNISFSGNFFLKIINPAIYLSIMAAAFQKLGCIGLVNSFWMLVPCYWLVRVIFMLYRNLFIFINRKYELLAFLMSLMAGECVFFVFIKGLVSNNEAIFSISEFKNAIWFAIAAYIFKIAWEMLKVGFTSEILYPDDAKKRIVLKQYNKFKKSMMIL